MSKIDLDKYYTPKELAKYCISKTKEIIGEQNITEYLEPSAGSGVFLDYLPEGIFAYDIEPEDGRIIKQDYLTLELSHKKGRCIIGNPPFGTRNTLSVKFYKKSIQICDYIAFILPISQLDNNQQMYEFDLIYSKDLGKKIYTDRSLHCCFNIYRRNINGLNKKTNYKLKDVDIIEVRQRSKNVTDYDIAICNLGKGCVGKEIKFSGQYSHELYIKINNFKLKNKIMTLIKNTNWEKDICKGISGQITLAQWQIYKYIKEQIPEIN